MRLYLAVLLAFAAFVACFVLPATLRTMDWLKAQQAQVQAELAAIR